MGGLPTRLEPFGVGFLQVSYGAAGLLGQPSAFDGTIEHWPNDLDEKIILVVDGLKDSAEVACSLRNLAVCQGRLRDIQGDVPFEHLELVANPLLRGVGDRDPSSQASINSRNVLSAARGVPALVAFTPSSVTGSIGRGFAFVTNGTHGGVRLS